MVQKARHLLQKKPDLESIYKNTEDKALQYGFKILSKEKEAEKKMNKAAKDRLAIQRMKIDKVNEKRAHVHVSQKDL